MKKLIKFKFPHTWNNGIVQIFAILLFCVLSYENSYAQELENVSGKIVDSSGEPLIGVNVVVDGTSTGTISDVDGKYTLQAPSDGVLVFSFIGFVAQKVQINGKSEINVTLKDDTEELGEVVVVGFGSQKKVNLTGSVGIVKAEEFEARPVQDAVTALQGAVPGLNITQSSTVGATLDASPSISVRGLGSIATDDVSDDPLVLIDGVEGSLSQVNPQDIESISLLKDAAASAIYGSRAPYGVLLVTTKTGKKGKPRVNYNNSFRFQTPIRMPELQDSWEWVNYFRDAFRNAGTSNNFDIDDYRQKIKDYRDGKLESNDVFWSEDGTGNGSSGKWNYDYGNANVNWLKEYYKDWSPSQEHNFSIAGGGDYVDYYVSANYMTRKGFMRYGGDEFDRYTLSSKINIKLNDFISVGTNTRYVKTDYERPTAMNDNFFNNVMRRCRTMRPKYDPNGYLASDINYIGTLRDGGRHKQQNEVLTETLNLKITPFKDFVINADLSAKLTNYWQHYEQHITYAHYSGLTEGYSSDATYAATITGFGTSYVYEKPERYTYLNPNIFGTYSKTINDNHNIKLMGGFQSEQNKTRSVTAGRADLITDDLPVLDLTTSSDSYDLGGDYQEWTTAGFFGRLNYDFAGKYLVEANLRYDGSSRFQQESRWVWTPSFSLGWNIAQENFMESLDFIDVLKLRGSYGRLANQNTKNWYPTYETIDAYTTNSNWLIDGTQENTAYIPEMISSSLTWEKVYTTNFGLDWGLLKSRLSGSFDYYIRQTKDMVGPGTDLPDILGRDVPDTNNLELETKGWELSISWRDKIRDFSYGLKLDLSDNWTDITKYYNATGDLDSYYSGERYGTIWGYTTKGIAKTQSEMDEHMDEADQTNLGFSEWAAGDIMYEDTNKDGVVSNGSNTLSDHGDLKIIGNSTSRYLCGIHLDAAWKGFDFQMFWQGVLKKDYNPGTRNMIFYGATGSGQWWSTALKQHLNYFRDETYSEDDTDGSDLGVNLDSYYPRPLFSDKNQQNQTRYLQNAAYMRLKNLQIGYSIPNSILSRVGIDKLRIFFSGENLATVTKLSKVMDPETAGIGKQGGTVYPLSKTYSFGLSVNF